MIRHTFMAIILVQVAVAAAVVTEVLWAGTNPSTAAPVTPIAPVTLIDVGQALPAKPPSSDPKLQRSSLLVLDPESAQAEID